MGVSGAVCTFVRATAPQILTPMFFVVVVFFDRLSTCFVRLSFYYCLNAHTSCPLRHICAW